LMVIQDQRKMQSWYSWIRYLWKRKLRKKVRNRKKMLSLSLNSSLTIGLYLNTLSLLRQMMPLWYQEPRSYHLRKLIIRITMTKACKGDSRNIEVEMLMTAAKLLKTFSMKLLVIKTYL